MTEQWKTDGDCRMCRRRKYCGTPCTRARRLMRMRIWDYIRTKTKAGKLIQATEQALGGYEHDDQND